MIKDQTAIFVTPHAFAYMLDMGCFEILAPLQNKNVSTDQEYLM